MNRVEYVVVSEAGTDWAHHADLARSQCSSVVTLVQWRKESSQEFVRRVHRRLAPLRGVRKMTLLCSSAADRRSVGARRQLVTECLNRLQGVSGRELTLVCQSTSGVRLPAWVNVLAAGIEERDPALDLYVELEDLATAA